MALCPASQQAAPAGGESPRSGWARGHSAGSDTPWGATLGGPGPSSAPPAPGGDRDGSESGAARHGTTARLGAGARRGDRAGHRDTGHGGRAGRGDGKRRGGGKPWGCGVAASRNRSGAELGRSRGAGRGGEGRERRRTQRRPGRTLLSRLPPSPGRSSVGPAVRMSQESLLGMDEGALRKLVSPTAAPGLGIRCAPVAVPGADRA